MCIGVPMQVVERRGSSALCRGDGELELVDTALVGDVAPGTWLMVFLGAAREIISAETAHRSANALLAIRLALDGETDLDHLFADLVSREPELPEHLRPSPPDAAHQSAAPDVKTCGD